MPKLTVTLPDGTTRDLPDGFPTTQAELDQIIQNRLAPKSARVTELEGQVTTLTAERDNATAEIGKRDTTITELTDANKTKDRDLLVQRVSTAKGVPARWLHGDDEAALTASADEWLADARGHGGSSGGENQGGQQQEQQGGSGGYVGSSGTGTETSARPSFAEARERAAERARNQQKGTLTT